jgi:glycosyltransferase involved in cell wall biosynthesis
MTSPPEPARRPALLEPRGRLQKIPRPIRRPVQLAVDAAKRVVRLAQGGSPLAGLGWRRLTATWRWVRAVMADSARRRQQDGLTVAVEIAPLYAPLTGIGWYLYQLVRDLADRPGLRLRLYGPSIFAHPDDTGPVVQLPDGPAIEWVRYVVPDDLILRRHWMLALLRALEPLLLAADGNRVLFAPNFIAPRAFALARAPLVATVHDLTVRRVPWTMLAHTREALERDLDRTIARARAIVTVSETVRADLLAPGVLAPGNVHAIHLAGRLDEVPRASRPAEVPPRFVLHVGTIEPRKNVALLLDAWPRLRASRPDAPPLVLCGHVGWQPESIADALARGRDEGWLIHLGYAPDPVVRALYEEAAALVCPSIYEGFGLPLVEAMAAGTPVVCSDIPVFREVADTVALFVAPDDADAWARAVEQVLTDGATAAGLRARGHARAATFSWRRTADQTLAVWDALAPQARLRGPAATR